MKNAGYYAGHLAKVDLDGKHGPEVMFRCYVSSEEARALSSLMLETGPTVLVCVDRVKALAGNDQEPDHHMQLRRIAEGVRARGDCGCGVVLADGTIATLSVNVPDPYAPRPTSSTLQEDT